MNFAHPFLFARSARMEILGSLKTPKIQGAGVEPAWGEL